jgi:hypothetical protein
MEIGVGITTTDKRLPHREYWKKLIAETSLFDGMKIHFVHNAESVAEGKNDCLRALQDCDHIFLFDEDTFPIQSGWAEWFIFHSKTSGNQHFSYLREVHQIRLVTTVGDIGVYNNSAGCMMYITKEGLEKVGAFDTKYSKYGFEHVNYSERCKRAGISGARNVCPIGADEYIYSLDMDAWKEFDFVHYSTLTPQEMEEAVKQNWEVFKNDQEPVIYLPL